MGYCLYGGSNMLYQIRADSRSGADARVKCRSSGAWSLRVYTWQIYHSSSTAPWNKRYISGSGPKRPSFDPTTKPWARSLRAIGPNAQYLPWRQQVCKRDAMDKISPFLFYPFSDAVLVTATLNCLGLLIRKRQTIVNKILSVILSFNPLKQANSPMTPKSKVQIKALERTTRALLLHVVRRYVPHRYSQRISNNFNVSETRVAPLFPASSNTSSV